MHRKKFLPFLIFCFFGLHSGAQDYPQDYFRSPLEIPLYLSGTFGELRSNHFHSGIDIKTKQREGQRVVAAAYGNVVRIKVSPYGFGKALYIRHPNGYTTVYAHLQRFSDEIEEYVREEQYRQKSFAVEIFPPSDKFTVEQGELIALSGNTGGSGGPHLHFEIRDTRTEKIINPLLFGFEVKDTQHPQLHNIEVYEFDEDELVSSYTRNLLHQGKGKYSLSGNDLIEATHKPAFGITTYDKLDGASNRNGVYHIQFLIGDQLYYDFRMESFAFNETRYINAHIDYSQKFCCRRDVNRLYLEPNNRFSMYGVKRRMNLPDLEPDSVYDAEIIVRDVAGNESKLQFRLAYNPDTLAPKVDVAELPMVFSYDRSNFFEEENIEVVMPEGALYRDVYLEYQRKEPCEECFSFVHELASRSIPVQEYYTIKIKPDVNFKGDKNKLAIASLMNGRVDEYEGGTWENGYVVARTRQFGEFAVVSDTIPPVIKPRDFRDGSDVSRFSRLSFFIDDDFSGIHNYHPTINGEWVLFEYDAKNDIIFADLEELDFEAGEHVLEIQVSDKKGNRTRKNYHLIF